MRLQRRAVGVRLHRSRGQAPQSPSHPGRQVDVAQTPLCVLCSQRLAFPFSLPCKAPARSAASLHAWPSAFGEQGSGGQLSRHARSTRGDLLHESPCLDLRQAIPKGSELMGISKNQML